MLKRFWWNNVQQYSLHSMAVSHQECTHCLPSCRESPSCGWQCHLPMAAPSSGRKYKEAQYGSLKCLVWGSLKPEWFINHLTHYIYIAPLPTPTQCVFSTVNYNVLGIFGDNVLKLYFKTIVQMVVSNTFHMGYHIMCLCIYTYIKGIERNRFKTPVLSVDWGWRKVRHGTRTFWPSGLKIQHWRFCQDFGWNLPSSIFKPEGTHNMAYLSLCIVL